MGQKHEKHKGRKAGTPNKVGTELRKALADLCTEYAGLDPDGKYSKHEDKLRKALDGLLEQEEYGAFIASYNAIRKTAVPDMKAVEHSFKEVPNITLAPLGKPKGKSDGTTD